MSTSCNSPCSHRKSTDGILCKECERLEERAFSAGARSRDALVRNLRALTVEARRFSHYSPNWNDRADSAIARADAALGEKE